MLKFRAFLYEGHAMKYYYYDTMDMQTFEITEDTTFYIYQAFENLYFLAAYSKRKAPHALVPNNEPYWLLENHQLPNELSPYYHIIFEISFDSKEQACCLTTRGFTAEEIEEYLRFKPDVTKKSNSLASDQPLASNKFFAFGALVAQNVQYIKKLSDLITLDIEQVQKLMSLIEQPIIRGKIDFMIQRMERLVDLVEKENCDIFDLLNFTPEELAAVFNDSVASQPQQDSDNIIKP